MAELTYREAVAEAIAQEMRRDEDVVFLGEDIGAAGGVFKATVGLFKEFGPVRVRDTPISEQAILGAAMGSAMTGLKPIAEIMFSDFLAVCWDIVANEIAKARYMTGGQMSMPLVIRTANGGGSRFGAQHSQSVENWAMMVPGLKVVAPSSPADVKGLLAAAIRDPDPVLFLEPARLYRSVKQDVEDDGRALPLDKCFTLRDGTDLTLVTWGAMVMDALAAAEALAAEGISAEVIDVASISRFDADTVLASVEKTGRCVIVHEAARTSGFGAEVAARLADEGLMSLMAPVERITAPDVIVPLPAMEELYIPSAARIREAARRAVAHQ